MSQTSQTSLRLPFVLCAIAFCAGLAIVFISLILQGIFGVHTTSQFMEKIAVVVASSEAGMLLLWVMAISNPNTMTLGEPND